jgi:hypothetical protein
MKTLLAEGRADTDEHAKAHRGIRELRALPSADLLANAALAVI